MYTTQKRNGCLISLSLLSAYTEAYNVCSIVVGPPSVSEGEVGGITADEEDAGRTSEDEDGVESGHDRQVSFKPFELYSLSNYFCY